MQTSDVAVPEIWRNKQHMCLDCRTVIAGPGQCPHQVSLELPSSHRVVSLGEDSEREDLKTSVWKSRVPKRGSILTGGWLMLLGLLESGWKLMVFVGVLWMLLFTVMNRDRSIDTEPTPKGAISQPSEFPSSGRFGTIEPTEQVAAPFTGELCVGYALELQGNGEVMLRNSDNIDFTVRLDCGNTVNVSRGSVIGYGPLQRIATEERQLAAYLSTVDPLYNAQSTESPLFVVDTAKQLLFRVGDRVEVASSMLTGPAASAGSVAFVKFRRQTEPV